MGRFLDLRIAENSSNTTYPGVAVPTTPTAPALVGQIGLQTKSVAGAGGLGGLIVDLSGVVGLAASLVPATVVFQIARATTTAGPSTIIYTANHLLLSTVTFPQLVPIQAADVTAPASEELVYQLLVHSEPLLATLPPIRTGPEQFSAIAMDGSSPTA